MDRITGSEARMDAIILSIKDRLPSLVDLYSIQYPNLPSQCKDFDINSTYELLVLFKKNPTYAKDSWNYNQNDNEKIKAIALTSFNKKYKELESIFSEAADIKCPEKKLLEIARQGLAITELLENPSTTKRVLLEIIKLPEKRITRGSKNPPKNSRNYYVLLGMRGLWAKPYYESGWEKVKTTSKDKDTLSIEVKNAIKNRGATYKTLRFPSKKIILEHPSCDLDFLKKHAQDEDWNVRVAVAENPNLTPDVLKKLAQDENRSVRVAVAKNPNTSVKILEELLSLSLGRYDNGIIYYVIKNPSTPTQLLEKIANQQYRPLNNLFVSAFIDNPNTPESIHFDPLLKWIYQEGKGIPYKGFSEPPHPKPKKIIAALGGLIRGKVYDETSELRHTKDKIKLDEFCKRYQYVILANDEDDNLGLVEAYFYAIEMEELGL